jgi:predicted Fe-Mo cluster-binding NifX family protein
VIIRELSMKVDITAQGPTLDALAEERFGRAPCLTFLDTDTIGFKAYENQYDISGGGVGPKADQMLID